MSQLGLWNETLAGLNHKRPHRIWTPKTSQAACFTRRRGDEASIDVQMYDSDRTSAQRAKAMQHALTHTGTEHTADPVS